MKRDWQIDAFDALLEMARARNMPSPDGPLGLAHLENMRLKIEETWPADKIGRWLGWAQAAVVASGVATLDDMMEMSRSFVERDAAPPTPEELATSSVEVKALCELHSTLLAARANDRFIDPRLHAWDWADTILKAATKLERLERQVAAQTSGRSTAVPASS